MPRLWTTIRLAGHVVDPLPHAGNRIQYDCRLAGIDMAGILIAGTGGRKTLRIPIAAIDTLWIPLDRVERASQRFTKNGLLIGVAAGLAIDVTAVYVISQIKIGPMNWGR